MADAELGRELDIPETTYGSNRSRLSLVGMSDQCRAFGERGVRTNGPTERAIADGGFDGATVDDVSLGIPSGLLELVIPDREI